MDDLIGAQRLFTDFERNGNIISLNKCFMALDDIIDEENNDSPKAFEIRRHFLSHYI